MSSNATNARLRLSRHCELGEGCLWDVQDQALYWVDILQNQVFRFDPSDGSNLVYGVGENVGTVVMTRNGKALLALRSGLCSFDFQSGRVTHLGDPERDKPHTRFNDGKCDPRGRFWAGTMVENGKIGDAALYCLDTDLGLRKMLGGVSCSNGLVWSNDQRQFFYIDTPTRQIQCFDYDGETGKIDGRRIIVGFPSQFGMPDGMAIDTDDGLWVAFFGGGKVARVDSRSGSIDCEVLVDAPNVTSCAFGGPSLNELFITTARVGMSATELAAFPNAGSLFSVVLPVRGQPCTRFARDL
jgi:sugar lactone lactonase YvrE